MALVKKIARKNKTLHMLMLAGWLFASYPILLPADQRNINEEFASPRFVGINSEKEISDSDDHGSAPHCALDTWTSLIWEVKTSDGDARDSHQTYSWFDSDDHLNGGFPGYRNRGNCKIASCDTESYIAYANKIHFCGRSDWRLPTREELRSLVDYEVPYPGPTVDRRMFPNTVSQFYWSATANANDRETAWGIGFSFGYDYAYFKSDHGYVRLVSGPRQ